MIDMFKRIHQILDTGEDIVLATIIRHSGSTPRTAGTRMVVRSDGTIEGTIGGGLVEARVIETARSMFPEKKSVVRTYDLKASGAMDSMDMLCGGNMTVLIEWVPADADNRLLYATVVAQMEARQDLMLVGILPGKETGANLPHRCLISDGIAIPENHAIADGEFRALRDAVWKQRQPVVLEGSAGQLIAEPVFGNGSVYIFGAGHISLDLARLTQMVGFRTVVLDDRKAFANVQRFDTADEVRTLGDFSHALSGLSMDSSSHVVIVTRGHSHDQTVLAQALRTPAGYIGMIGSRRKRDAIYENLLAEGFTEKDLDRVHSPIGLAIGAQTPAEISVSIVGELIAHRAGLDRAKP